MQDRPSGPDLIEAVAQFLNEEILPLMADNPRLKFRSLIAINVLNIVTREMHEAEPLMQAEWQRLADFFDQSAAKMPSHPDQLGQTIDDFNRTLCRRLRTGDTGDDEWSRQLADHLYQTTIEKLQIANPRFLERERQS